MSQIFIKSVACVIPGFTDLEEGELITTEEILTNIRTLDANGSPDEGFNPAFVRKAIGIESVAISKTSAEFVRKHWQLGSKVSASEIFASSQSTPNLSLNRMLAKAVSKCVKELGDKEASSGADGIIAHIHITSFLSPHMEPEFYRLRQSMGIGSKKPLQTLILQQGCSGLLTALDTAKAILTGHAAGSNVLITADNNMMLHAHQRCKKVATTSNVNQWLWPAIFGEGAGAIIAGTLDLENVSQLPNRLFFSVDHLEFEIVENNWRVAHNWMPEEGSTEVVIKAKEVRDTYLKNIRIHAERAIKKCEGLDQIHRLCLHESNPKLISQLQNELGMPPDMIPSISRRVGTLACVSAFSLLDIAIGSLARDLPHPTDGGKKSKIALALIGEAGGNIIAGNFCLSAKKC